MRFCMTERTTKEWFVLSVVGSVSTTAILLVVGHDTNKDVARLEQRVKELEGSTDALRDEVSDLSRQVGAAQERFWE
jgi:hypothetical protein